MASFFGGLLPTDEKPQLVKYLFENAKIGFSTERVVFVMLFSFLFTAVLYLVKADLPLSHVGK